MADYYPLIARAVAGLDKNSGENRRALYERARAALLAQLRGVTPALNESDITRERLALEESIRKVEAESARKFIETPRHSPAPKMRPPESRPAENAEEYSTPPRRYVNPPSPSAPDGRQDAGRRPRPAVPPPARATPSLPPTAKPPPEAPRSGPPGQEPLASGTGTAQLRHPLRRPIGERPAPADDKELRNFPSNDLGEAPVRTERAPRNANAPPSIAELDRAQRARERDRVQDRERDRAQDRAQDRVQDRVQDRPRDSGRDRAQDFPPFDRAEMLDPQAPTESGFDAQQESHAQHDFAEPMLESAFPVDDAHPVAGKGRRGLPAEEDAEFSGPAARAREWLAWRPSRELIRGLAAAVVGLVLVGVLAWQWRNMVELYRAMRAPAVETAREAPPSTARPKITDRIEPGSQSSTAPAPPTQAGTAVAQKVVLYEEDPADPNGKRFVGSAIWRTETVTPGPGQTPELAIRADVEVPERKLTMTWSLRRNIDKALPASHTVEIVFKLPADFPSGGISNVPGILMKQAEQTRGVPLSGLAVKVTNGFFLIGLSSVEAEKERNLQLLKDRAWFDIPVVYNNNRRAILAMEKGTPGERAFTEAFKVWKQ
jgi:hypothetical protein